MLTKFRYLKTTSILCLISFFICGSIINCAKPRNDANLSSLALYQGTLSPTFDPLITSYYASVADPAVSTTVTATPALEGASITVQGVNVEPGVSSGEIKLSNEITNISVQVTSPDNTITKNYTITVKLFGWQLNENNTGLAGIGLKCSDLPVYTGEIKPAAGTVIREMRITTPLDLSAGDITIERCCVQPTYVGMGMPILTTTDYNHQPYSPAPAMVTVRDSDIDGSLIHGEDIIVDGYNQYNYPIAKSCAFMGIGTIERCYIHDMGSGIAFMRTGDHLNAIAEGNFIHRLRAWGNPATTGSHNESMTIRDFVVDAAHPGRQAIIRNNRLESFSGNDSGAFFIQTYAGDINQVLIEGNIFASYGWQLALEARFGHIYGTSMMSRNNRFTHDGYGPSYITASGLTYGWALWENNYYDDPTKGEHRGAVINCPRP